MSIKNRMMVLAIVLPSLWMNAQNYMNYFADNYAGVQAVLQNPASIADSRYRTDVNIVSVSQAVSNDAVGISIWDLTKSAYDVERDAVKSLSTDNNAISYTDIMGPSVMFNILPNKTVALFTRARAVGNVNGIDGNFANGIRERETNLESFTSSMRANAVAHAWGEIGLSYATVLRNKEDRFLKGGITLKYLQFGASAYSHFVNSGITFNNTGDPLTSTLNIKSTVTVGGINTQAADKKPDVRPYANGLGFDFGFVYEIRPDWEKYKVVRTRIEDNKYRHLNKYKYRFGVSITDIGYMKYTDYRKEFFEINGSYTEKELTNAGNLATYFGAPLVTYEDLYTFLPTTMHLDADWHIDRKFYLNFNANLSLKDSYAMNSSTTTNYYILSPRIETRYFTFMLPINYMEYSGLQMGGGLRIGPFFAGTSSILRNWLSRNSKAADFYIGFKVPIYQTRLKKVFSKECNCDKPVYDWD